MNQTTLKIFSVFVVTAAVTATILLMVNFLGFAIIGTDTNSAETAPRRILSEISGNLEQSADGFSLRDKSVLPSAHWCMLVGENGDVLWSENKPAEVPTHYSINDIARMTRWFLCDYPVYVQTEDYGLLVLGLPKNTLGKYTVEYSMEWFETLFHRILGVLVLNLCLATFLALLCGAALYRNLKQLTGAIVDLRQEKSVKLKEKGLFKEVSRNLNQASQVIERKNAALAARDNARANWIAGISHDIRTPLAVASGYAESLSGSHALSEQDRKKAGTILTNILKIKRLIDDLNLISSLQYDMQPSKKSPVKLCPLIRGVVSDMINNGLPKSFSINLTLKTEKATVAGDDALLERALFNLINNAVCHNENGCEIRITEETFQNNVRIVISDNGRGVPADRLAAISEFPKTTHGVGLPMSYRIVHVHGGTMNAYNNDGFTVEILLPLQ